MEVDLGTGHWPMHRVLTIMDKPVTEVMSQQNHIEDPLWLITYILCVIYVKSEIYIKLKLQILYNYGNKIAFQPGISRQKLLSTSRCFQQNTQHNFETLVFAWSFVV